MNDGPHEREQRKLSLRFQISTSLMHVVFANLAVLAAGIVLARVLGKDGFGRISYVAATTVLVTTFTKLGMDRALFYFYPSLGEARRRQRGMVSYAVVVVGVLSVAAGVTLYLLRHILQAEVIRVSTFVTDAFFYLLTVPIFGLFLVLVAALTAQGRNDLRTLCTYVVVPGSFLVLAVPAALAGLGPTGVLWMRAASWAIGLALAATLVFRRLRGGGPGASLSRPDAFGWHRYALPLLMADVVTYAMEHIDVIMLGGFVDEGEIGLYAVASRLAVLGLVGGITFNAVLSPRVSKAHHEGVLTAYRPTITRASSWLVLLTLWLSGCLFLGAELVLTLIGRDYLASGPSMSWLLAGVTVSGVTAVAGTLLTMTGRTRLELLNASVAAGMNVVANLLLVPRFGITGAAIATVLSLAVAATLRVIEVSAIFRWYPVMPAQLLLLVFGAGALWVGHLTGGLFENHIIGAIAAVAAFSLLLAATGLTTLRLACGPFRASATLPDGSEES